MSKTKKPELTVKAIMAKDKKREVDKKKRKKKTEVDKKYDEAYDLLLKYHEGYTADVEKGRCCD